jgi:oligosaccharide repeat unit polymerase
MTRGSLSFVIDILGLVSVAAISMHGILAPTDKLAVTAIITALCFWLSLRTIVIYGCGDRLWPAPAALFLFATLIMGQIGAFLHYANPIVVPQYGAVRLIWGFNLAYLGIAFGTALYVKLNGLNTALLVDRFYDRRPAMTASIKPLLLPSLVVFIAGLGLSMITLGGGLPILKAVMMLAKGDFSGLYLYGLATRGMNKTLGVYRFQGYLDQMRVAVLPMLSLLWVSYAQMTRDRVYKILAWVGVGGTCLLLVALLERGPIFIYLIQLLVLSMLLNRPRITLKGVLYGLGGTLLIFFILTNLLGRSQAKTLGESLSIQSGAVLQRIFLTSSEVNARTMATFPELLPFRNGATLRDNLVALLPGPKVLLSREMYVLFYGGDSTGTASIHSIAELWANGGYLAIILGSILMGLIFQWLNVRIMTLDPKSPLALTVWAIIAFLLGSWSLGPLTTPTDRGLIAVLLLYALLRGFEKIQLRAYFARPRPAPEPTAAEPTAATIS